MKSRAVGYHQSYPPATPLLERSDAPGVSGSDSLPTKSVEAKQAAIDQLPLNSGTWRVRGIPGLYVRCRRQTKSFLLQRRVHGKLVKRVLGPLPMKLARELALKMWASLKPVPARSRKTFEQAFNEYLREKQLASKTREIYQYDFEHYLGHWKARLLEELGYDRSGVRAWFVGLAQQHGNAIAARTLRMFRAVYNYARRVEPDLPECPTIAVQLSPIKPRDWALSEQELQEWWQRVSKLPALKRTFWLTCLLTGARRGSVESLRWEDIDFTRKLINFRVAKGGRSYVVPAADRLLALLEGWRRQALPSEWVFPSSRRAAHLINVRDDKRGIASSHHLRHTFRTTLAQLGATPDQARLLMGHVLPAHDISAGYITAPLVIESLRPLANRVAEQYAGMLRWDWS